MIIFKHSAAYLSKSDCLNRITHHCSISLEPLLAMFIFGHVPAHAWEAWSQRFTMAHGLRLHKADIDKLMNWFTKCHSMHSLFKQFAPVHTIQQVFVLQYLQNFYCQSKCCLRKFNFSILCIKSKFFLFLDFVLVGVSMD